ncbi:N-acetyl-D-Glu racemase DgcA [Marinicaulis aureus]|uniref:Dipeptide epimerase n=1 Tax=Hyphococcus aureus TaxID=2666033 RepID=A0ABW1L0J5_9PROT
MRIDVKRVDWALKTPLKIANYSQSVIETVQVSLNDAGATGRGEGIPVFYRGETADTMVEQLSAIAGDIRNGAGRAELQSLMPAGGARNAVDCAFWDLEAKRTGRRAWSLAGVNAVKPLKTVFTLSVDDPQVMAARAKEATYDVFKLKLDGGADLDRVAAVRAARHDAVIVVDANQSWTFEQLCEWAPRFYELGVELIEQPLPAGGDGALADFESPVPLCADESCQTAASLGDIRDRYQVVNIKLDKAGGLTEGLRLVREAKTMNLRLMVGCMAGSSLSMAPAFIIGQFCEFVDLDGPLLAETDMENAIRYDGNMVGQPEAALWG